MYQSLTHLVTVSAILLVSACGQEPAPVELVRPVLAIQVGANEGLGGRSFPGRAQAAQEVDLSFRVNGPLIELPNDIVGREYQQGEVIARIDPEDYEVKVRDVEAQLDSAKSKVKRAEGEFRREQNIFKEDPGATSKTAVDRKRDTRDQAKAEAASLQASMDAARNDLSYTRLNAPFSGTVVAKYVDNFQDVRAKQAVVRLLDSSRIKLVVDLPENMISRLPYVKDISIEFDAFPDLHIPATIFEVGTEASRTTRTFPVTLIMDQPEDVTILAGMAGRASGTTQSPEEAAAQGIVIPVGAVFTPDIEDQNSVWVIDETKQMASRRNVTTGALTHSGISIIEGLEPGEWIATAGVHSLHEGQKVRLIKDRGE